MKKMMLAAAVAAFGAAQLAAVTVGPDWCVAYPQEGSKEVNSALRVAAEEVADDINEATGLKLEAVPASGKRPARRKPPFRQAAPARYAMRERISPPSSSGLRSLREAGIPPVFQMK